MARRAKESDLGADEKGIQITEALDRKRRQLDRDIAEFRADKEHEYRSFERQVRGKCRENGVQDVPQGQRKRGSSKQNNDAVEAGSVQKEEAKHLQGKSDDEKPSRKSPGPGARDHITTGRANSSPGGSLDPPDRPTEALQEREREFQGFFTPSHLRLLGDAPADEGDRSKEPLEPPSCNSGNLIAARHNNTAMLSSSAEAVHLPMTSPPLPPARPLSSSVPPEEPSHRRSDSSRSDNSIASLRSSLRDPKQPRSPKRVLFSIDDTLVSPSTSPIAQRSNPVTLAKSADPVDTIGGFEKFEVVRNKNDNGAASNMAQTNDVGLSSSGALVNGWTTGLSMFGRAAESNPSKPSPFANGADEFEHLESDDLFTFDEDMGWTGKSKSRETNTGDEYNEDLEVDEKIKEPLTASSPHAGSLPIEIKWRGRREVRD